VLVNCHELLRGGHRQRADDEGVEQAEDGGVGADSERQGQNGGGRESGVLAQHAQRVSEVLEESLQGRPSPLRARVLHA